MIRAQGKCIESIFDPLSTEINFDLNLGFPPRVWNNFPRSESAALRALLAGATLAVKSDGKDRAKNAQAGRQRKR
jgi:hypothetical protein